MSAQFATAKTAALARTPFTRADRRAARPSSAPAEARRNRRVSVISTRSSSRLRTEAPPRCTCSVVSSRASSRRVVMTCSTCDRTPSSTRASRCARRCVRLLALARKCSFTRASFFFPRALALTGPRLSTDRSPVVYRTAGRNSARAPFKRTVSRVTSTGRSSPRLTATNRP